RSFPQFPQARRRVYLKKKDFLSEQWGAPQLKDTALPELRARGRTLAERGIKVLLSGIGGDQVFTASVDPCYMADLLWRFRWKQVLREAVLWQKSLSRPISSVLLEFGIRPIFRPNTVFRLAKGLDEVLPWISTSFWRKLSVRGRMLHRKGFLPRRFSSPARQRHYLSIRRTSAVMVQALMMGAPVEVRYPYMDRALVEFAMALPMQQLMRPGETRSLLRRGMRGILPEMIRTRKSKGMFGETLLLKLAHERPVLEEWLKAPYAAAYGYIDPVEFRRELDLALVGTSRNGYLFMAAISLELWLRGNGPRAQGGNSCTFDGV
ncbi:MAG: asparagine synthase-related protein, partial [Candidatus Micrarchaeaceae archaeon]